MWPMSMINSMREDVRLYSQIPKKLKNNNNDNFFNG